MATESMSRTGQERESGMLRKLLKTPCPQGEISPFESGSIIKFRNALQMAYVLRKYGDTPDHSLANAWLEKNSGAFREAFEYMTSVDPRFFDGYATIGDLPEIAWEGMSEVIEKRAAPLD